MSSHIGPAALLFVLCAAQSACVAVPAYQRGVLVQKPMHGDPNPLATQLEQHVFEYREGSSGGTGTVGGGCGCN